MEFQVRLPLFEGPLALLLELVERRELDITSLSLARVTGEYLEALARLPRLEPDELAAFLVVASRLLLLKSRLLLPGPGGDEEGAQGQELLLQLREYRRYKRAAQGLAEREESGWRAFLRVSPPPRPLAWPGLEGVGLEDLTRLLRAALLAASPEPETPPATARTVTIEDLMERIERSLGQGPLAFTTLLAGCRSRLELVVAFMAVLELLHRRRLRVRQEELFGEILLEAPG